MSQVHIKVTSRSERYTF